MGRFIKTNRKSKKLHKLAQKSPNRPKYHFCAPSLWMNDPNGPIYYKGEYHLFYQHNPYKNKWGRIHWGHAKTKDLVHWEHLPIALKPSRDKGEKHCFSGDCVIDDDTPKIIYTKIGHLWHVLRGAEQWLAVGDEELLNWKKSTKNPIMTDDLHDKNIRQWRDPFLWKEKNFWYCIIAGHYRWKHHGVVFLYRSEDLMNWEYIHPLYEGTKEQGWCFECPNFFPLKEKYILILSPFDKVIYGIGKYKNLKFNPETWHTLNHSDDFYATNILNDKQNRTILFGWIKGGGKLWNGCISLPRILSLSKKNKLSMKPILELQKLRIDCYEINNIELEDLGENCQVLTHLDTDTFEIKADFETSKEGSFGFLIQNGKEQLKLGINSKENRIFMGEKGGLMTQITDFSKITFHVFIDAPIFELFANYQECISIHYKFKEISEKRFKIAVFSEHVALNCSNIKIWKLRSINV